MKRKKNKQGIMKIAPRSAAKSVALQGPHGMTDSDLGTMHLSLAAKI